MDVLAWAGLIGNKKKNHRRQKSKDIKKTSATQLPTLKARVSAT